MPLVWKPNLSLQRQPIPTQLGVTGVEREEEREREIEGDRGRDRGREEESGRGYACVSERANQLELR